MNKKATKQLKEKLLDQQKTRKYKDVELPKQVGGQHTSITKTTLPTRSQLKKVHNDDERDMARYYPFKPEPSMPGFNSFNNQHKVRKTHKRELVGSINM